MKKIIASWVLGILAIVTFFFGFVDALSQRKERIDLRTKRYQDSLYREYLRLRASDSIIYLRNDLWNSIKKKHEHNK